MANQSNVVKRPLTIDDIINEIKEKSADGDFIYRGQRQVYDNVSSALYREYIEIREHIKIDLEDFEFDLGIVEKEMLKVAKKHIGEPPKRVIEDFVDMKSRSVQEMIIAETLQRFIQKDEEDENIEILTQLQHYGGITNLIDFTTDYLIAIFFACSGESKQDGQVIVLKQTENIKNMIIHPQNPLRRVIAQKSVFLHPPEGFIDIPEKDKVSIPATLKEKFLKYLRKYHSISAETIYNDIYGFIRNQSIHRNTYIQFNLGLTLQLRGNQTKRGEEKQEAYKDAIVHYDQSIELDPELRAAYGNRAECWLHLENWDEAKKDFSIAISIGYDIIGSFHNDYENVAEFEEKTGLKMPPDIAEMLGG